MAEEIKKSEIKEFHLKFARSLRAEPEVMELLQKTQDDLTRMWLVLCLTDGMDTDNIIGLNGMNISKIQIARNEYLKQKYMQAEELYGTVSKLKEQVAQELHESREIRRSIEKGLEETIQEQMKTQLELIASKDDMIGVLKRQIVEMERRQYQMEKEYSIQKEKIVDNRTLQYQEERDEKERNREKMEDFINQNVEKQKMPEQKQGLKRFMAYKRKVSDSKRFIEEFIKNDKMNSEQKEYLLQCLEEGVSVKEIEIFASANLPVDIMRRLRKYYELQTQGTQQ